jgi:hypothetical protein
MHALLDIIRERSGRRLCKEDLAYGYAVVFPHLDYDGSPPPHADKAIIISTHILEEVAAVCTRAIVIARGRVVADATPAALAGRGPVLDTVFRDLTLGQGAA